MTSEEPLSSCLVLIHVVPPLIFTVMPFPATPTNYLAVPSPSLGVCHCNKRVMRKLFLHQYLQLAQLFTRGIVDIAFQSTAKMPHPQGRARLNIAKLLGCLPPWTVRWGMWIKYSDIYISSSPESFCSDVLLHLLWMWHREGSPAVFNAHIIAYLRDSAAYHIWLKLLADSRVASE